MATDKWLLGLNGNWLDANRWSLGAPPNGFTDDALIAAPGTYTVRVTTADVTANTIELNSAGATLLETAAGSFDWELLRIRAGTCILNGSNGTGTGIEMFGGLLKVANAGALGGGDLFLNGGEILFARSATFSNALHIFGPTVIAAETGSTPTLTGSVTNMAGGSLTLGAPDAAGTIILNLAGGGLGASGVFDIAAGTVRADGGISTLTNHAATIVELGATFDLNSQEMIVQNLEGAGTITNTNAIKSNISLNGGTFAGTITGNIGVSVKDAARFTGASTYTGGTLLFLGKTLTLGDGGATGSIKGAVSGGGTLAIDHGNTITLGNDLGGTMNLSLIGTGTVKMKHANTYTGTTTVFDGVLSLSNADALGTSDVVLAGGEVLATKSLSIINAMDVTGTAIVAAAHGTVLGFNPDSLDLYGTLILGTPGADGTISFDRGSGGTAGSAIIDIRAGTVFLQDNSFGLYTEFGGGTIIEAGATLDLTAQAPTFSLLTGSGTITATGLGAEARLAGANFAGTLIGGLSVRVTGPAVLTGENTYTGSTVIDAGGLLALGNGGATGSVAGDISDDGQLLFARSGVVTFDHQILGAGSVSQLGPGTLVLTGANPYSGGTFVNGGVLALAHKNALGTGDVHLQGGKLRSDITQTLANALSFDRDATFAAAHGKTVTLTGQTVVGDAGTTVTIGSAGNDGTVVWAAGATTSIATGYTLDIAGGTVVDGGVRFDKVGNQAGHVTVEGGATLDVTGHFLSMHDLTGAGTITNSGALVAFGINGAHFAGHIDGAIWVNVFAGASATLSAAAPSSARSSSRMLRCT